MGIRTIKTPVGRTPKQTPLPKAGVGIVSGAALGGKANPKPMTGTSVGRAIAKVKRRTSNGYMVK